MAAFLRRGRECNGDVLAANRKSSGVKQTFALSGINRRLGAIPCGGEGETGKRRNRLGVDGCPKSLNNITRSFNCVHKCILNADHSQAAYALFDLQIVLPGSLANIDMPSQGPNCELGSEYRVHDGS